MSTESNGSIRRFFSNPAVGFVGSIASVISLGLAVYFYLEARETRELRYFVNPARAVVVHAGQTSRLSITLDGTPVKRDVSAAQIAFWNEGHATIKPDNVLRSLVVKTSPIAPIIEATIRKRSRDVVKIDLDRSRLGLGELIVHWNILEFHDGGVLQIIYLGEVNTPVTAKATVEGQGALPEPLVAKESWWLLFTTLGPLAFLDYQVTIFMRRKGWPLWVLSSALVALYGSSLIYLANLYLKSEVSSGIGPPFGF